MRQLIILCLATMAIVYQNCSSNEPHKLDAQSNPTGPAGPLSGRVLDLYDMGEISGFNYEVSGGLMGMQTRLFVGVDPAYISASRNDLRSSGQIACTMVMYTLTADEVAILNFALSKISLRSIPASNVQVSDCPTALLKIDLKQGNDPEWEFNAGICSSSGAVKTVVDDPAGLQELFEDLVTKYGCNDPS